MFAQRWRNDALWPELQNSLPDPNQYVHTLLLLAAHHVWSVAGNVVKLEAGRRHNAKGEGGISQDGTTGPDSLGVGYATDREDL